MGAAGWLIGSRLRVRAGALTLLGLVVALGATATFVAVGAGTRTRNAFPDYLQRAAVGDVVINPSLVSRAIDHVVRTLPNVTAVTSDAVLDATLDEGVPRPQRALDADPTAPLVLGSTDGRFTSMDRPTIVHGRLPTGRAEAMVNAEQAADRHLRIGDVIPVAFWSRSRVAEPPTAVEHPVGVEHLTIVGIATLPDEVLPDGVYPRRRVIVSADIADRYDCLPESPAPDATLEAAISLLAPKTCSTQYQLYSLATRGGDRDVTTALAAFATRSEALTAALPKALRATGAEYTLVAKTRTHDEANRVRQATTPVAVALVVLGVAAGAITLAIVGLMLARELARSQREQVEWWHLGMTTRERSRVVVAPLLAAVIAGLAAAVPLAWLISPVGPVGSVRAVDPERARMVSRSVWLSALGLAVAFALLAALLARRSAQRVTAATTLPRTSALQRLVRASSRPDVDEGVRAAINTNRGTAMTIALAGTAVAVLLAALVFGASLSELTSTPESYGWPWDVGIVRNDGYTQPGAGLDAKGVTRVLAHQTGVRRFTMLGFSNAITLDGDAVPAVFSFDRVSAVDVTIVKGRLPVRDNEVAIGARTAADHGLGVGASVAIAGPEVGSRHATVSAIVVLPSLGPLAADRAAPGRGVLVPQAMLQPAVVDSSVTFVGIDLAPGADSRATRATVGRAFDGSDSTGTPVLDFTSAVRPPEIINARSARVAPLIVGALLVVAATIGLTVAIIASVRARRRDLAALRALGFTGRQLRNSVRVQALATMLGGLVAGVPVGIATGRTAWHVFATELGVATKVTIPVTWIAATGIGAAVVALLAAAQPARVAANTETAVALRSE